MARVRTDDARDRFVQTLSIRPEALIAESSAEAEAESQLTRNPTKAR